MPVLKTDISLLVHGLMVDALVEQTFTNPGSSSIEAVYAFPLPDGAAVDAMEIWVGERRIAAEIRESETARATYEEAHRSGRRGALVNAVAGSLFTTRVARVDPGEEVAVRFSFVAPVEYEKGEFRTAIPLTFNPRYPNRRNAEGLGETRLTRDFVPVEQSAQSAPRGPMARIRVELWCELPLAEIYSPSHPIVREQRGRDWIIHTESAEIPADRDFELRWRVRSRPDANVALFMEETGGARDYGLLVLLPPDLPTPVGDFRTETLFLVDVSGSMAGASLRCAQASLQQAIDRLGPGDRFQLMRFNDASAFYRAQFSLASEAAKRGAGEWIEALEADGGTEIEAALDRALGAFAPPEGDFISRVVLLTDGAVEDGSRALSLVEARPGHVRIHCLGIGTAPHRPFMRRMAELGGGRSAFLLDAADVSAELDSFLSRLHRPVLAAPRIEFDGHPDPMSVHVRPNLLPDLHRGDLIAVSLEFPAAEAPESIRLVGHTPSGRYERDLTVPPGRKGSAGLRLRWAQMELERLMDRERRGEGDATDEIVALGLEHSLVTPHTSLVAVEYRPPADPGGGAPSESLPVANDLPVGGVLLPEGGLAISSRARVALWAWALAAALWFQGKILANRRPWWRRP